MPARELVRRTSARSIDELLAGATDRRPMKTDDSKSSAEFERVTINGERFVVKHFAGGDWLAEASADTTARAVSLWEDGVYDAVANLVDHTVVGAARGDGDGDGDAAYPAALLMRDASGDLIPLDAAVDETTHAAILDTMAALHARFWGDPPHATYMPFALNYRILSPRQARIEHSRGDRSEVLRLVEPGWAAVFAELRDVAECIAPLLDDPQPLVDAFAATPVTFLHGDWKMGNLGHRRDGTLVLLDWDRPAVGPATAELAWYVAVNCDRLPESKDATVERFRKALEHYGVDTQPWWDTQLRLSLMGAFLQLGWSKAGQADELAWWRDRVVDTARCL